MTKDNPSASVKNQKIATSGVLPHLCPYKRLMVDGFTSSGSKSVENRSPRVTFAGTTSTKESELDQTTSQKKSKSFDCKVSGSSKDQFFIKTGTCEASENGWFFAFQRKRAVPLGIHEAPLIAILSKTESALNMKAKTVLQESEVTFTPLGEAVKTPSCGRTMADGSEIGCGSAVHSA